MAMTRLCAQQGRVELGLVVMPHKRSGTLVPGFRKVSYSFDDRFCVRYLQQVFLGRGRVMNKEMINLLEIETILREKEELGGGGGGGVY